MKYTCLPLLLFLHLGLIIHGQTRTQLQGQTSARYPSERSINRFATKANGDLFGKAKSFIENVGQYGDSLAGYGTMGKILYGFEGFDRPLLFTPKGVVHMQSRTKSLTHEEKEVLERKGMREEEIERKNVVTNRVISMEWLDANPDPYVIAEDQLPAYHNYGMLPRRARAYKTILYKQVYPGIDILFSFTDSRQTGVEYSIIIRPGADLSKVRIRFGGDIKSVKLGKNGNWSISSDIGGFTQSNPKCYYGDRVSTDRTATAQSDDPMVRTTIKSNILSFAFPADHRPVRTVVIDPFISSTNNLTGTYAGKAKDVNFDYAGNVYVAGGGNEAQYELAKFDPLGNLLWTFSGSVPGIPYPGWAFGQLYGGWTVEKSTGYTYLGQGINALGAQIIRLDPNGQYDNFITNQNLNLLEMWKLFWYCNSGKPEIITCGGSTSSNDNFGILVPPAATLTPTNITGRPDDNINGGCCQDISDIAVDPNTNNIYIYFNSLYVAGNGGTTGLDNHIYKFSPPYTAANILWNVPSGYSVLGEGYNRPYMGGTYPYTTDNSANILAVNSSYLFYWDGVHLQAYDKGSGAPVGNVLSVSANQPLMQGGIYADECNHVFIGFPNGTIKVYLFNGSTFDDAAATDISVPGYSSAAVYSLAYDNARQLLYVSGDGFVAAFDISAYCPSQAYTVEITPNCFTNSASASVTPSPPTGSTIDYILLNGTFQIGTNTTGQFSGLQSGVTYTMKAILNEGCSGVAIESSFSMPQISLTVTATPATCGNATGGIAALATGGMAPYSYSTDGLHFQSGANFSGLAAGMYTVYVKDVNGCTGDIRIAVSNQDGPVLVVSKIDATCGNSTGTINARATGGNGVIQYSIDGVNFQSGGVFSGLSGGQYTITARDAAGCTNTQPVDIVSAASTPTVFGSVTNAICGVQQGAILAQATGGTPPYQYSVNNQPLQGSSIFSGLPAGNYNLVAQDANGCTATAQETIQQICIFSVSAISTNAECFSYDGSLTATVVNGTAPYTYSIDGVNFFTSNTFSYLKSGYYTVTAKDANATLATTTVLVGYSCPTVSVTGTSASCGNQNGTIVATGVNGTEPYQYSLDGTNFQAGNTFTGLAPGTYTVTMEDAKGMYATAKEIVYNSCPLVTAVATDASCGLSNGTITATGNNGTPPYQYSIDGINFQSGNVFSNVAAGTYTITLIDALRALSATDVTINNTPGPQLTASATNATCNNNDGSIKASASGGTGALLYSLDDSHFQSDNVFSGLSTDTYDVYVRDAAGCSTSQSVTVPLSNDLTLHIQGQDTICEGNKLTLIAQTNATSFSWTPTNGLSDPTQESPVANPNTTTAYLLTASTGPCAQTGTVVVLVNPAPVASVNGDTIICYGGNAQLSGGGGVNFAWNPPTFLTDKNSPDPVATAMTASTAYSLVVTDALGCSSIIPAIVNVTVTPPAQLFAGDDTAIHINQTLQLDAVDLNNSGFTQYEWLPSTGLSDANGKDPVATITQNITYTVLATTAGGCRATDSISIKVYDLSDIFVPGGFTPNGDGHNDFLKAIPMGIREFKFFSVFNRWGQRVFYTTDPLFGWNGMLNGVPQNPGTYVWFTEGVDFLGNIIAKKGTTVLIK